MAKGRRARGQVGKAYRGLATHRLGVVVCPIRPRTTPTEAVDLLRISVFGSGYVGTVTTAGLVRDGHEVIVVDVNGEKVEKIAQGLSPVLEPGVEELLSKAVQDGKLRAMMDTEEAVFSSEVSLICVGTPQAERGGTDLKYVFQVCQDIAKAIRLKKQVQVVVLRSTVPPGTAARCQELLSVIAGDNKSHLVSNPEFLREGTALMDFSQPSYTVVGTDDPFAERVLREMYAELQAPFLVVSSMVAEMIKYTTNAWHAAKVAFANEIGRVSKRLGIHGGEVMDILVRDTKLNVSAAYMKPGFAFGGSCLPKDLEGLVHCAHDLSAPVPLLESLKVTNDLQVELAVAEVLQHKVRRVSVLGLAFKVGTDDLRESPIVLLVKRLLGEGYQIRIYDEAVAKAQLIGTNREYIQVHLPHFEELLSANASTALEGTELVVLAHYTPEAMLALRQVPQAIPVVDLTDGLANGGDLSERIQ